MRAPEDDRSAVLEVVRGNATPEEVAAVVVVLAALTSGSAMVATPSAATSTNGWAARWRGLRRPLRHGTDGWRLSDRE